MLKSGTCRKYAIDVTSSCYVNPNIARFTSIWFQIILAFVWSINLIWNQSLIDTDFNMLDHVTNSQDNVSKLQTLLARSEGRRRFQVAWNDNQIAR